MEAWDPSLSCCSDPGSVEVGDSLQLLRSARPKYQTLPEATVSLGLSPTEPVHPLDLRDSCDSPSVHVVRYNLVEAWSS